MLNNPLQHKKSLEENEIYEKDPFELLIDLWQECKKFNEVPTQIIIGSRVYKKLQKVDKWRDNFQTISHTAFQQAGVVGIILGIEVLTDYYFEDKETQPWSIDENEVVFNIGSKIVGRL